MTTFTSEDRENAKLVEEAPYHPGYEDAVVYPTVIVDSGASIKSLGAYIELEQRLEMYRDQILMMQAEIQRLKRRLMELGETE
jgi:hypothetical protein